ncbi:hypothetical protein ACIQZO_33500 [Streptomyces sp. NPDC097617]|uniref:hypothetical protein n=1 Tax=Streptomyces sp. NPDC097617 TaxID=3366091 RepID=UPI0038282ABF
MCEVSVRAAEAVAAKLTCGGQAEVLLQPLASIPAQWWELLGDGVGVALATRLNETADRAVSEVVRAAEAPRDDAGLRAGELPATRRAGRDALYGEFGLVLVEAFPSAPYVVIGGGGELAEIIERQALLLGWEAALGAAISFAFPAGSPRCSRPSLMCSYVVRASGRIRGAWPASCSLSLVSRLVRLASRVSFGALARASTPDGPRYPGAAEHNGLE